MYALITVPTQSDDQNEISLLAITSTVELAQTWALELETELDQSDYLDDETPPVITPVWEHIEGSFMMMGQREALVWDAESGASYRILGRDDLKVDE